MKTRTIVAVLAVTAMLGLLVAAGSVGAGPRAQSGGKGEAPVMALAVPSLINYQGRLLDGAGDAVADGSYTMTFRLYDVSLGGAALWTETKAVTVAGGLFTTLLGDTTALNPSLFDGSDLWLGVQVGADPEMSPRQRIVSVPYAIYSSDADTLDGSDSSAFSSAAHDHDDRYVNDDGDLMTGDLDHAPVLDVVNTGSGFGVSGYSESNIGVFGGSGEGSGLLGISGLIGVYGNGEGTGVVGAGQQYGVRAMGNEGVRATGDITGVTGIGGLFETGVYGEAPSGVGVMGKGDAGVIGDGQIGVRGTGLTGIHGESTNGDGVYGETNSPSFTQAGVHGKSTNLAPGVYGEAAASNGVVGVGGAGEYGGSFTGGSGVYGRSSTGFGVGVTGVSSDNYGVRGESMNSHGVYGQAVGTGAAVHGVFGETSGDWGWASGVYGTASQDHAIGVTGWNTAGGAGVYGSSVSGVGVVAVSESGNILEAWDASPLERRFYVSNDGDAYADGDVQIQGNLNVAGNLNAPAPTCVQYDVSVAGETVVEVPSFCIDRICMIVMWNGATMGAFGPGFWWPAFYMQSSADNTWIGGPSLSIAGGSFSAGAGVNGDASGEGVFLGGETVAGGYVRLLDDGTAESSPSQWTIDFVPHPPTLTRGSYYICPWFSPAAP